MNSKKVFSVLRQLDEMADELGHEKTNLCKRIICYLKDNSQQHEITIGGLLAALKLPISLMLDVSCALSTLCDSRIKVFEMQYKICYENSIEVAAYLSSDQFFTAKQNKFFVDVNGSEIIASDLEKNKVLCFINKLTK